jgi:hypothetical protein
MNVFFYFDTLDLWIFCDIYNKHIMIIQKTPDEILPYTYLLKFNINNVIKYYYGVRYGNVRLGLPPSKDLFITYFTSSISVKNLLESNIYPFEIVIHKTFNTSKEACEYEVKFLTRIDAKNRQDFINLTNNFNNSLPYSNKGRILSEETKKKISFFSSKIQNTDEYREFRRDLMLEKWSSPDFKQKMKVKNDIFWKSDKGKEQIEKVKKNWIGRKHKNETKEKMSLSAIESCLKIDCVKRAMNRPRYVCPICNKENLDGGNFNSHMLSKHNWNKDNCIIFKKNYNSQE